MNTEPTTAGALLPPTTCSVFAGVELRKGDSMSEENEPNSETDSIAHGDCRPVSCSLLRFSRTDESRIWAMNPPCDMLIVEVYDDGNVVLLATRGEKTEVATIVEANAEVSRGDGSASQPQKKS